MLSVRPKVTEFSFHLFGRSIHPELFKVHKSREFSRNGYTARVEIINAGHLITWRYKQAVLTEVSTSKLHPLPQQRRCVHQDLFGKKKASYECPTSGIKYESSFQLETAQPELFWQYQKQLAKSENHMGLVYNFDSSGRLAIGATSYIYVETRDNSMLVQAFHTFPDDGAIVKSESIFRIG